MKTKEIWKSDLFGKFDASKIELFEFEEIWDDAMKHGMLVATTFITKDGNSDLAIERIKSAATHIENLTQ